MHERLPTDPRHRLENTLLRVAARLARAGIEQRPVVDDRRGGDRLAVAAAVPRATGPEHVELAVLRYEAHHAGARLFAASEAASNAFAAAVRGIASEVSRFATVERGALKGIERLAEALHEAFAGVATWSGYPRAALESLRQVFPRAQPLRGCATALRPIGFGRPRHSIATVWGAVVPTPAGPRAARFNPPERGFVLPPGAVRALRARGEDLGRKRLAALAIAPLTFAGLREDEDHPVATALDVVDAVDTGCDVLEVGLQCLPDCSPDCGSFDCGSLDCGSVDCMPLDCVPLDCGF